MHVYEFLTGLQNGEISPVTLLKNDSITRFPGNFKNYHKITGNVYNVQSAFSIVVGGWLDSSNYLKVSLLKDFPWNFPKLSKHLWKMYEVIFYKRLVSRSTIILSLQSNDVIYLFLANFLLFQNTQRKHFLWSLFLLRSEIMDCRSVAL